MLASLAAIPTLVESAPLFARVGVNQHLHGFNPPPALLIRALDPSDVVVTDFHPWISESAVAGSVVHCSSVNPNGLLPYDLALAVDAALLACLVTTLSERISMGDGAECFSW